MSEGGPPGQAALHHAVEGRKPGKSALQKLVSKVAMTVESAPATWATAITHTHTHREKKREPSVTSWLMTHAFASPILVFYRMTLMSKTEPDLSAKRTSAQEQHAQHQPLPRRVIQGYEH